MLRSRQMKKADLIREMASRIGGDAGDAADQVDRAVNRIIRTAARREAGAASRPRHDNSRQDMDFQSRAKMTLEELGRLIQRSLQRSKAVEIDGLGVFARDKTGDISFQHSNKLRVFIAYAREDRVRAERLFDALTARGFAAWLDRRKLLPGQDWPHRIEDAIDSSDFFIACFSAHSVRKRGGFQTGAPVRARLRQPRTAR